VLEGASVGWRFVYVVRIGCDGRGCGRVLVVACLLGGGGWRTAVI
jgi:hypothetical protein